MISGDDSSHISHQWQRISGVLRDEFGEAAYQSWLKPMSVRALKNGAVTLAVPTRFMRDWVMAHYIERMRDLWGCENPLVERIDIIVQGDRGQGAVVSSIGRASGGEDTAKCVSAGAARQGVNGVVRPATRAGTDVWCAAGRAAGARALGASRGLAAGGSLSGGPGNASNLTASGPASGQTAGQSSGYAAAATDLSDDIGAPLDPRFTFDGFVVGKPNEFAYAAARRVSSAERPPFNPLFLYGGVGLGKTHLLHAIGWAIRGLEPHRQVIYLSAEKFMYRFIRALREQNTVDFKEQFRSVDVLMIDDVQFISGKESTQEEFFHTFNALVDQGRQIVLSADKSPSDLEGIQERLKSRLNCGLVADIHATTYELRLGILHSKSENLGIEIPRKVMEFLAHRITANVRELEGALNRVVAHAQLVGRAITLETTQEVLQDLLRANDRRITIDEIQKQVAAHFNIRIADMHSARRARAVARPRQVAMYLAKQLTARSLPEIGRKFGGRDHTTVMHAVKKVEELIALDSAFAEDVELLRRMLES